MYEYLDSGGGSITGYVCQNLENCTLKSVNIAICKLTYIFFKGKVSEVQPARKWETQDSNPTV